MSKSLRFDISESLQRQAASAEGCVYTLQFACLFVLILEPSDKAGFRNENANITNVKGRRLYKIPFGSFRRL